MLNRGAGASATCRRSSRTARRGGRRLCLIVALRRRLRRPPERDPRAIRADIADGYVSRESARELYD